MKIIHVITGLENGGAEGALYRLVVASKHQHTHIVVSLTSLGKYGTLLADNDVDVVCLNMRQGRVSFSGIQKLFRLFRNDKPDVVQTWMYHADLFGGVIARVAGIKNIIWGIRHTSHDVKLSSFSIRVVTRLCGYLSSIIPRKIISCSTKAVPLHVNLGYQQDKFEVVPNGYDFLNLKYHSIGAEEIRAELGLDNETFFIGCVGRWNPQKDHLNLIKSLSLLKKKQSQFHCVFVGSNCIDSNEVLVRQIEDHGVSDRVTLMGPRDDIVALMSAFDIHILPSAYGEAFPNVVVEAMACHTPCVVTDVGDAAYIVNEFGWVVPTRNSRALCQAISTAMQFRKTNKWEMMCDNARHHVRTNFSVEKMSDLYLKVWSWG